ncbi:M20 family metallo-hydrolase [Faecalibacter rhinopitheci]|uniref:M20 family metallo-hydrolase n=1 Tax=Faecalibacter rhinopitheci TaxID=2779678 RepID=A0A8J7FWU5_9FLAO|nr:M20 family metallo-hydrolase [Faecalibacter rhinopitheci]MBF0598136.1 M20 family metallo-hydrolase [Faecalibacter rhinopitheci]MBQ0148125.1 M20 family metallo-hydrolase [Candidatus Onthonaster equi]
MLALNELKQKAVDLLCQLIETQSFSSEEDQTAEIIVNFLKVNGATPQRQDNNVYAIHPGYDEAKKTILLNSHHDTVKFGKSWTYDALKATIEGDKLTGLGSNDAGASAVSLLATFINYLNEDLPFNLIVAITAEEESSGDLNVGSLLPSLPKIDLGIVGEPTKMDMAIAERGLIVFDVVVKGKTGHAARNEGVNAIYEALDTINWFKTHEFEKISDLLGPVKTTVTQIIAGKQHNVVPDECTLVVDCRVNELYTNEEVAEIIQAALPHADVVPRSLRLNSSRIAMDHPIVQRGIALGCSTYGSPTMSDQTMMSFDTIKIGPGDSARSHTPDEYILISEIEHGINRYIQLLKDFKF